MRTNNLSRRGLIFSGLSAAGVSTGLTSCSIRNPNLILSADQKLANQLIGQLDSMLALLANGQQPKQFNQLNLPKFFQTQLNQLHSRQKLPAELQSKSVKNQGSFWAQLKRLQTEMETGISTATDPDLIIILGACRASYAQLEASISK